MSVKNKLVVLRRRVDVFAARLAGLESALTEGGSLERMDLDQLGADGMQVHQLFQELVDEYHRSKAP